MNTRNFDDYSYTYLLVARDSGVKTGPVGQGGRLHPDGVVLQHGHAWVETQERATLGSFVIAGVAVF